MSEVVIEAQGLTKRYGDVTALLEASFEVNKGEVLGFLGPNGAGKTTTMKILTAFVAPTEGTARVNGYDVFENPLEVRRSLGYLPESNPLYIEMLTLEFLEWVARMRGLRGADARQRIRKIVEETAIGDVIAKQIAALSKGYRQRVGLAAALMHEPPILILDEPMNGLDPNQAIEIRQLIKDIGKERTVILSTHNLFEVQLTCDRVLIVSNGRIVADDRPDELRARGGKPRYLVAVAEEGESPGSSDERITDILERIPRVQSVVTMPGSPAHEQHYEVLANTTDDLRPAIYEAVKEADLAVLELSRQPVNLETVFRELTLEGDAAKKSQARTKKKEAERRKERRQRAAPKASEQDPAEEAPASEPRDDAQDASKASAAAADEGGGASQPDEGSQDTTKAGEDAEAEEGERA